MYRSISAVLASLAILAAVNPIAALPLESRQATEPKPGAPTPPTITVPAPVPPIGQPGVQLGPDGLKLGNPGTGGGSVTFGPGGVQITPGTPVTVGTPKPAQPAPGKPPQDRHVMDKDEASVSED